MYGKPSHKKGWQNGLPGSGKSSLSSTLAKELSFEGLLFTYFLIVISYSLAIIADEMDRIYENWRDIS